MYVIYTKNLNYEDSDFLCYAIREHKDEADRVIDYLETKGYKYDSACDTNTNDTMMFVVKPKTLDTNIRDILKNFVISDLTTAEYAFYEGHITFKQYNQIVKDLKERSN